MTFFSICDRIKAHKEGRDIMEINEYIIKMKQLSEEENSLKAERSRLALTEIELKNKKRKGKKELQDINNQMNRLQDHRKSIRESYQKKKRANLAKLLIYSFVTLIGILSLFLHLPMVMNFIVALSVTGVIVYIDKKINQGINNATYRLKKANIKSKKSYQHFLKRNRAKIDKLLEEKNWLNINIEEYDQTLSIIHEQYEKLQSELERLNQDLKNLKNQKIEMNQNTKFKAHYRNNRMIINEFDSP